MKRHAAFLFVPALIAFNATSTNFYVRQNVESISGGNSAYPISTSTTYKLVGAGGQTALGTSTSGTSFSVRSGFLHTLFVSVKPSYEQTHFHWRNDNGSEAAATSATGNSQDTTLTGLIKGTTVRLRVQVSNEGGTQGSYASQQFRLEYGLRSTTCAAIASWVNVGDNGGDWDMADSTNLTNGNNTTNIAVSTGGVSDSNAVFLGGGGVLDTASQSGAVFVPSDSFFELEYSVKALSGATDGATYCLRVTNAGSTSLFTYSSYAMATLTGSSLSLTVSSNSFAAVTPGAVLFATTTLDVSTSNSTGWSVSLTSDDRSPSNTAMDLDSDASVGVTDQTEWIAGQATTSAGNAVRIASLANSGNVLAFRVMTASGTPAFRASSWWGSADSYADSATTLWAGLASSSALTSSIGNSSVQSGGNALNTVLYYLKVPISQRNGAYTAPLTVTATANP